MNEMCPPLSRIALDLPHRSVLTAGGTGLIEHLRWSFARHADLVAVEAQSGSLTYRELDDRSAALAGRLAFANVRAGVTVPLLMRRSVALVIAQVAVLRLGAAYAPLDTSSPRPRLRAMLEALGARIALTDALDDCITLPGLRWFDVHEASASPSTTPERWRSGAPADPVCVMFTSGTTGVSKGVVIPQRAVRRLVCDAHYAEFRPHARWGFLSSPAFDASTLEVWAPLLNGGCCVVQEEANPSLNDLADFIRSMRLSDAWLTSALFNALVEDRLDAFQFLQQLLVGGERVSPRHIGLVMDAYPSLRVINGYGPTENTTFSLCHPVTSRDLANPLGVPIGQPIGGTRVRIGSDSAQADEGELLVGGEGLASSYLNDDGLTAAKFIELDGQRWYRTGDWVRRCGDGLFYFLGRVDRQVKLQGHRVELDEVESVMAACPGIGTGAVMVCGESSETRHLVACYSGLNGNALLPNVVGAFLRERLPPASVPAVLLPLPTLPLSITGKLDRNALAALVGTRLGAEPIAREDWQTPTERHLAAIWQRCMPQARLHRAADFLQCGGTSLRALRVSSLVREQLGHDLTPVDVLRLPILFEQARQIDRAKAYLEVERPSAADAASQMPLTEGQQALLDSTALDVTGCAMQVHVAVHLKGPIAPASLRAAFVTLANRHPSLRMTIRPGARASTAQIREQLTEGWWQQHAALDAAPTDLAWPMDLLLFINRPMNLHRDGVMRVDHWTVDDGSCLVVWSVHHVAVDESSIDRCLAELDQILNGAVLAPVFGSALGFASVETAWRDHDAVACWSPILRQALANEPPPFGAVLGVGRELQMQVPPGLTARLQAATQAQGVTPFSYLLTAFGISLQEVFGPARRFVVTPLSRRADPALIEPVGYLLDLRLVESGRRLGESARQALERVQGCVTSLQRPSFLPWVELVESISEHASIAQHLGAFAFTWRLEPARQVPMGPTRAQLLRVPQHAPRFGLTLHASLIDTQLVVTIEAVEAAFAAGHVGSVADSFFRQLEALLLKPCQLAAPPTAFASLPNPQAPGSVDTAALRAAWSRWLKHPPTTGTDDFLRSGGNSLTWMRMSAELRRAHGFVIDPAAFLMHPTFDNLCRLAAAAKLSPPRDCVVVGRFDAPHVTVLIPGSGGQALGLVRLATSLQARSGPNHAVVVLDLAAMLGEQHRPHSLDVLCGRVDAAVAAIGAPRIKTIIGFSLGGLLALDLAQRFEWAAPLKVWLLDTYAPRTMRTAASGKRSLWLRLERRLSRLLLRGTEAPLPVDSSHDIGWDENDAGVDSGWAPLREQLSAKPARAPSLDVHLVQALQSVHHLGLLWRRGTNGLIPRHFGRWRLHHVKAMHLDIPRSMVTEIVELILTHAPNTSDLRSE